MAPPPPPPVHTYTHTHTAHTITRCGSLIPLVGPAMCGLNKRPYFTCKNAMAKHIHKLALCYKETWASKTLSHRPYKTRIYAYRRRHREQEMEDACLLHALHGMLTTGLMPPSSYTTSMAKGGASSAFRGDFTQFWQGGASISRPTHSHFDSRKTTMSPRQLRCQCVERTT